MSNIPYPGLRPHRFEENHIFFGRGEYINLLTERLKTNHFIAVVGQSGCGKSSLVKAGLLPTLLNSEIWHVASFRPLNSPFHCAATALLENIPPDQCPTLRAEYLAYSQLNENEINQAEAQLENQLRQSAESLYSRLPHILKPERKLLIIVDQFEEIFRYGQNAEEIDLFIQWLLKTAEYKDAHVVITMRGEYLTQCSHQYPLLYPYLNQENVLVPPMSNEQLKEAIEKPASICGGKVDAALTDELLKTNFPDKLSLLQHALMLMWNKLAQEEKNKDLTLKLYSEFLEKDLGNALSLKKDLENALSNNAEQAYCSLSSEEQYVAEILFRQLSQKDEKGEYTRLTATLAEIIALSNTNAGMVINVIDAFRIPSRRFLMPAIEELRLEPSSIIDITHESLIRQWPRVRQWADDEYELAKYYRFLDESISLWQAGRAGLHTGKNLETDNSWYEKVNAVYKTDEQKIAWAKRYHKDFSRVEDFRKKSQEQEKQEQQRVVTQRQQKEALNRERFRLKFAAVVITGLFIVTAIIGYLGVTINEIKTQRTYELFNSQKIHATLFTKTADYAAAQQLLQKTHQLDEDINSSPLLHARNLLEWFTQLMRAQPTTTFSTTDAVLNNLAISKNGQFTVAVGEQGTVAVFDNQSGQLIQFLTGHSDTVRAVVFDPQNQWFATAGDDQQILFWSMPSTNKSQQLKAWSTPQPVWALAVTPDGQQLVSSGKGDVIQLWDFNTDQKVADFTGHTGSVADLAIDAQGRLLASASYDDTARLWNIAERKELYTLSAHTDHVQAVAFSPDSKTLATASNDKTIRLWQVASGTAQGNPFEGHTNQVFDVIFLANGKQLISASSDKNLRIWDKDSGVTLRVLQDHTAFVTAVTVYGEKIASVSTDGTVKWWHNNLPYQQSIPLETEPASVAIAPTGDKVAVGFANGKLQLYALPLISQEPFVNSSIIHQRDIQRIAFDNKGNQLVTASLDGTAKLWKIEDHQLHLIHTVTHEKGVNAVCFSPDDKFLLTASYDGNMGITDLATQKTEFYPVHEGKGVNVVDFDIEGKNLLTASDDDIRLWRFKELQSTGSLKPLQITPHSELWWASLAPQAEYYTGAGRRKFSVNVYQSEGELAHEFVGHEGTVIKTIFSPDGWQLASASTDGTIRLWDLKNSTALFTLQLPTKPRRGKFNPLWDFDFQCVQENHLSCWLAAPLTEGELLVYRINNY